VPWSTLLPYTTLFRSWFLFAEFLEARTGFRTGTQNKCAPIAARQLQQLAICFSPQNLLRSSHDLLQHLQLRALLGDEHFRVTDDVDKQDLSDFELHV